MEKRFALIGRSLKHSNSPKLFHKYITNDDYSYELCEVEPNELNRSIIEQYNGCNITIPYKTDIIKYLDELDIIADEIHSVNCIENNNGRLIGHNTDYIGIDKTLKPYLDTNQIAIILGNGGASKTVQYYLHKHNIKYIIAGRHDCNILYKDIQNLGIFDYIINTTPVGMFPNVNDKLNLPYNTIKNETVIFDLIYNPSPTSFLKECSKYTNIILDGTKMLEEQALASYKIWKINI